MELPPNGARCNEIFLENHIKKVSVIFGEQETPLTIIIFYPDKLGISITIFFLYVLIKINYIFNYYNYAYWKT